MDHQLTVIEEDKRLWIPPWLEGDPNPPDHRAAPEDRNVHVNTVPGEVEVADTETMLREIQRFGKVDEEPEIGRARDLGVVWPPPEAEAEVGIESYISDHPTHFDFRPDVARFVARIQKLFPWLTFMNTYYRHPPVFGRRLEFVSVDTWQGGLVDGRYVGYRGKPLDPDLGARVFNAIFNDPYAPPIYWIIYRGRMWTRGYGWGPSPGGPPDSDPRHDWHIHLSCLLTY